MHLLTYNLKKPSFFSKAFPNGTLSMILLNILLACEIAGLNGLLIIVYRGILGKKNSMGLLHCRTHTPPFKLLRSQEPQPYKYEITLTYKLIIKQKYPTHFSLRKDKQIWLIDGEDTCTREY